MIENALLVINAGYSSLKFGIYSRKEGGEKLAFGDSANGIGQSYGKIALRASEDHMLRSENLIFES